MKTARALLPTIAVAGLLAIGWVIDPVEVWSQATSEIGKPMPGTTQDFEDTRKQPDPLTMHSQESNQQVTLGGAQYFVEGEIIKIEGQKFDVKKTEGGEGVRLVVNQDTNLDCSMAPAGSGEKPSDTLASDRIPVEKQSSKASDQQRIQGQRKDETARGAGFRIGQCEFHPGDFVKAEVDDMGRVTTLKYLASLPTAAPREIGESAGAGELAMPGRQEKPGQLDMTGAGGSMPKEYAVLPIPVGEMKMTTGNVLLSEPVKDQQGKMVGTLERLIIDAHSGRIEYAVLAIENGTHLHPVPWSAIKVKHDNKGHLVPTIDTSKYQIMPSIMREQSQDLSPSVNQIVMEMQVLREREPSKSQSRGPTVKEPAMGGPMGEDKAGGAGLSGERALPPEKDAPSFKREKENRD